MDNKPTYNELQERVKELELRYDAAITQPKELQDSHAMVLAKDETAFNNAPFSISHLDQKLRIVKINPLMEQLIDRKSNEVEGRYCYDVWGQYAKDDTREGRDRICDACRIKGALKDGKVYTYVRRVAGRYIEVTATPVKAQDGTVIGAMEYGSDITEKKQAEEALRKSEEKFSTVADFNYDWEYWIGSDDKFVYISPSVKRITGYTANEFYEDADLLLKVIHPDDQNNFARHKHNLLDDDELEPLEFRIVTKAGDERWISHGCRKIFAKDGKYLGIRGSNRDITDKKLADFALLENQAKLQSILNSAPLGIGFSKDRIINFVNQKILDVSGYSAAEIIGKSSRIFFENNDEFERVGRERLSQLKTQSTAAIETRFTDKAGRVIDAYFTSVPISPGEPEKGFIFTVTDISRLKKSESAKTELQVKLMEARKMETIATLAGGIAHDFNNALTSVIGNVELLKMDPTGHDAESCAEAVEESAYRMADLTKQLLAYARGGKYQAQETNLQQFIEKELQEMRNSVDSKIEIVSQLECQEEQVVVDRGQLQMVFHAIISNAIEAIECIGRVEISCHLQELSEQFIQTHLGSEYGSYVCFSVEDNGCGMNEETLKRIFEPFYSTKFAGRGLGMAAVYGIVKNHGGYISVDSKPKHGTSVRVYLPRATPKSIKIPEQKVKSTVLLVEDEEMLHFVEKRLLEVLGYHVLLAINGKEAMQMARDYDATIDIALIDVHLPDITADMLYMKLVEARPTIKVLLCSGSALEWTSQKALNAGAKGFIQKPFSLHQLNEMLAQTINGH